MNYPKARRDPLREQPGYRLWVNADRTLAVELWPGGQMNAMTREHDSHTWGPPIDLEEERIRRAS